MLHDEKLNPRAEFWSAIRRQHLIIFVYNQSSLLSSRSVTKRCLRHRRRKVSRYSNMPWTHQAIQNPDMECPPASFLPVISSRFQMSVFRWAPLSNNVAPTEN